MRARRGTSRRSRPAAIAIAALVLLPACGLLVGIEPLDVAGGSSTGDELPPPEAGPIEDGPARDVAINPETGLPPRRPTMPKDATYTYAVSGKDVISFFSITSNYGPTATVAYKAIDRDCYEMKLHIRNGYDESMTMCLADYDVAQTKGSRTQSFNVANAATTITCVPGDVYFTPEPERLPLPLWPHVCTGKNTDDQSGGSEFTTKGTYAFTRRELRQIAGRQVEVLHFHDERAVTGAQTGTNVADWYFNPASGVLLGLVRKISIKYPAPIVGQVTYTEDLTMTLSEIPDAGADGAVP